jgi:subtilisin family serine protease
VNKNLACTLAAVLCVPAAGLTSSAAVASSATRAHGARASVPESSYRVRRDVTAGSLNFANTEPLASEQWYLEQDHAWDHWPEQPTLAPVKVAVIDSGIDYSHPEFVGRVAAGISFVGGSWKRDTDGHGTFVAGEIAANPSNGVGIAGLAFNAQLLIAKVVPDGPNSTVSLPAEIKAIYWAVNHGAKVINLSIGGVRDPVDPNLDSFSLEEEAAVEYAYAKGAIVVAAVGNGPQAPRTPWNFADYPAALPHVIGVTALRQNGSVPDYSNRDVKYADLAAPGDSIFSTVPRNLIDSTRADCVGVPYSNCGPFEFQSGIGTSFAAPQVSAAAALLLGVNPRLTPDQVGWLLERTAVDVNVNDGCRTCATGRDSLTGWGRLNIAAALGAITDGGSLPQADAHEPNDDAGALAHHIGTAGTITGTLDYWDDPVDVYSVTLAKGDELFARLTRVTKAPTTLSLWKPGTVHVFGNRALKTDRAARSTSVGNQQRLSFTAPASGTYYVEVTLTAPLRAVDAYALAVAKRPTAT